MTFSIVKQTTYIRQCSICYGLDEECSGCKGLDLEDPITYPVFITVYEETLGYGGPEEGGWWYDIGTILEMVQVDTEEQENVIVAMFTKRYNDPDDKFLKRGKTSAAGGYDIILAITKDKGRSYPEIRPHYE